ncbi:hypothetical protein G7054_g8354 [Neopestalotiopsis clavispora]|nr:hypothetical protein E8E14_012639 [Neopestalotiopsis sp. 37M]KAF7532001.1 hypothetical protein G7054_g8354 [Neopestalotiopsis clavispora]
MRSFMLIILAVAAVVALWATPVGAEDSIAPFDMEKTTWMDLMMDPRNTEESHKEPKGLLLACLNDIFHPAGANANVTGPLMVAPNTDQAFEDAKKAPHKFKPMYMVVPQNHRARWPDSVTLMDVPFPCRELTHHVSQLDQYIHLSNRRASVVNNVDGKKSIRINHINGLQMNLFRKLANDDETFIWPLNVILIKLIGDGKP